MNKQIKYSLILIFVTFFLTMNASIAGPKSVVIDGSKFPNTIKADQWSLHLKGTALLRHLVFVKAYAGALYLPELVDGDRALNDIPRHLVLEYKVAISADDFARATTTKIKESVSQDEYNQLSSRIEQLNNLYEDVNPGDRYSLTYHPDSGTQLLLNGNRLGAVDGADFSKALFSIWIGKNPIDKTFRDKLLGKRR